MTLLGLVDTGSSKKIGKREVIKEIEDVVMKNDKRVKWKTKADMLEISDSASVISMKSPQFSKRR